ncbi:MAG: hypothetical protein RJQ09_21125 [Cyclobacteriaceae bacterium]
MKSLLYFVTRILFYFYSFELKIIDPPNRKSLTKVPTVFKVYGSLWWRIILGAATILVLVAGLSQLALSAQLPSKSEIISFVFIGLLIIIAFLNQLILKGRIEVHEKFIVFDYRNIFGRQNRLVELSAYKNIWVQKMKTRMGMEFAGTPYVKVRIKHKWTRFRSIQLYEGPMNENKIKFYSELFNLPIKESLVTIRENR